jgi:hypothetical protein
MASRRKPASVRSGRRCIHYVLRARRSSFSTIRQSVSPVLTECRQQQPAIRFGDVARDRQVNRHPMSLRKPMLREASEY